MAQPDQKRKRWNLQNKNSFSEQIENKTEWDDLIAKMGNQLGTIDDYKALMYTCHARRKEFVSLFLSCCSNTSDSQQVQTFVEVTNKSADFLKTVLNALGNSCNSSHEKELLSTNNQKFSVCLKDELMGLKKDIAFLENFRSLFKQWQSSDQKISLSRYLIRHLDFLSFLTPFHHNEFAKEHSNCVSFLKRFIVPGPEDKRKPILISDWDGTMKDYCSQYVTNLQPIYSAISLAKFSLEYTRLAAVLTAGPLRGPGIIDLTALPKNGPIVIGGSWGREWWLDDKRVVNDEGISDEGLNALERLWDEMMDLLTTNKEFSQFALIGSGIQRKVDRLTLGVQTVFNHVSPELSARYQHEVRERLHRVDPNGQILHFEPSTGLEVEIVVHSDKTVWNKADGINQLIGSIDESLDADNTLICGDTFSDLPMVRYGASKNKTGGLMALFVTTDKELQQRVIDTVGEPDRCCFVSTPDVIHAAMITVLAQDDIKKGEN